MFSEVTLMVTSVRENINADSSKLLILLNVYCRMIVLLYFLGLLNPMNDQMSFQLFLSNNEKVVILRGKNKTKKKTTHNSLESFATHRERESAKTSPSFNIR